MLAGQVVAGAVAGPLSGATTRQHARLLGLPTGTNRLLQQAVNALMLTTNPEATANPERDSAHAEEVVLAEWSVHLMATEPHKVWGVAAAVVLAAAVGGLALHHWMGSVLGSVFVMGSAAEFLLPIRYRLTSKSVHCAYGLARLEMPWRGIRRIIQERDGLRLSPFSSPSRLDAFRGIYLRYPIADTSASRPEIERLVRDSVEIARSGR